MNDAEQNLLVVMISQSSEMWLAVRDRNSPDSGVIICENPSHAFYLERADNYKVAPTAAFCEGWVVIEQPLLMADACEFFAAFGSKWPHWIGAVIGDGPLRAFIKNGRQEGWSISLGASKQDGGPS